MRLPFVTRQSPPAGWNQTQQLYSRDLCVHQLVARQAIRTGGNVAVVAGLEFVTYSELDARANQLARHLCSLGIRPEARVGICLPRSPEMIVAALAILKVNGAFVPLDPSYPAERLCFILRDADVPVLVTTRNVAEQLPSGSWQVLALDSEAQYIASHPADPLPESVTTNCLAYVIYTSGSTGRPKGVEITHDSLLNLVFWHQHAFDVTSADRAGQLSSPAFDASVWELWPYLTVGASVHLAECPTRMAPSALQDWIVAGRITIVFVPSPMAENLIELKWPANSALRVLLTGADTLHRYPPPSLPFALVNNYGPTECTVVATSGTVSPGQQPECLPPIGRPIANTQIYILNENLQEVTIGTPGELYIGGIGLARGYLNRPALTAETFISNPLSTDLGSRLYKTGDLARYLPDGQIIFLGRIDDQVKIRGYRIEPNEILAALVGHPMIQASFVMAREDQPGDKKLVAYVVPVPQAELTYRMLREFLATKVPEYMIPAVFVMLDSLPLNVGGKIDRSALPVLAEANVLRDEDYLAPRTLVEERISDLLGSLLSVQMVGANDNFFLLGGNSLLAAQVITRVRETFKVELSFLTVFNYPTVADLSIQIEGLLATKMNASTRNEAQHVATTRGNGTGL